MRFTVHRLTQRCASPRSHGVRGLYVATCACGWDIYGITLPSLWKRHDQHLGAVRAASIANHPSRRRP